MLKPLLNKDKKGGVVTATVMGVAMLVVGTILILVVTKTLLDANLLTDGGTQDIAATEMSGNFTDGIDEISTKIPTILLIVAVVFLFGALVLLVTQARRMGVGSGGGSL